MSDQVLGFSGTVPANGAITIPCDTGLSDVTEIVVVVPPGPSGLVGFAIYAGGSPAYPSDANDYFVLDDYVLTISVSNQINSGQWSIVAYNTDTNDHTLRAYFYFNNVQYVPGAFTSSPVSV